VHDPPLLTVADLWALGSESEVASSLMELGAVQRDIERIKAAFFHHREASRKEHLRKEASKAGLAMPGGSAGGIYDPKFLEAVSELYDLHMGVENMAPLLYSLVRFIKPKQVLEIGAGYTSIFILQALADNEREIASYAALQELDLCQCGNVPWCVSLITEGCEAKSSSSSGVDRRLPRWRNNVLHCVDNLAHEHTTAHRVKQVAAKLGVEEHLLLHVGDAWEFELPMQSNSDDDQEAQMLDMIWADFGAGQRLDEFFERWWPKLRPGGHVLVHSTVTNAMTRSWLENMRRRCAGGLPQDEVDAPKLGSFETMSFVEPHKRFQSSFSAFQKRSDGFCDPVLTRLP